MNSTPVPAEKVQRLLDAKKSTLALMPRTIRNAVEAARQDGVTRYVGATYLSYFIETTVDSALAQHVKFVVTGDQVMEVAK
jgi:polysaccharide deacetylase 2 family uncharacterized protein YibQ